MPVIFTPGEYPDDEPSRRAFIGANQEAVGEPPARQRRAGALRYLENRSIPEIAERLDVREVTVDSLLRHGVNGLCRRFRI